MLVNFCDSFIHIPQYCFINNEVIMIYPADNRVSANHYSDVIMSAMALQIPVSRVFAQLFVQAQIKENIKDLRHKGPIMFPFVDVIM